MTSRGRRHAAAVVVVGLMAATLFAGSTSTASATSATTPGCSVTDAGASGDAGLDTFIADDPYDRPAGLDAACLTGLAGSLCVAVWQVTTPLASRQALGAASLCRTMSLLAQLR